MTLELDPAHAGSRQGLTVGEHAVLRLPESPTTGYRWQADFDAAALRLIDDRSEVAQTPRGSSGDRVLTFEAVRPGPVSLRLANRRSWESGDPVAEFTVELDVRPTA